ncbi:hypothetical protein SAMN02745911_0554 [Aureimonas altamirensis DSM 21988]|uniref:DUF6894 domain-containing protein n=1 Tax=Aureimonas altamirensis DSM 21988 TaxID=1121026 RepID=A0ABY1I420_9HYPH|nr:hypothetical protein SAMN02745911_0554 [Aureimonas altamirensis DSM 21988]
MPLYFFHVAGAVTINDDVGTVLADDHAACLTLVQSTAEVVKDAGDKFCPSAEVRASVVDRDGHSLMQLKLTLMPQRSAPSRR